MPKAQNRKTIDRFQTAKNVSDRAMKPGIAERKVGVAGGVLTCG